MYNPIVAGSLSLPEFLKSLPDLGARPQSNMHAADFTLDRIRGLLAEVGNPQQKYPSVHVAGTNGKGSVCALCAASFQEQGYRVGLFTSPHIHGALHGIRINGEVARVDELEETFQAMSPVLSSSNGWTHFEIVTTLAFLHFLRKKVDAAVIEVGLGGRLDATNVITPVVTVITSIDYDHISILGNTLKEIATEKAGIIKPGVPVVVAPQTAEAKQAILSVAKAQNSPVIQVGKDYLFDRLRSNLDGQDLRVWEKSTGNGLNLHINMLGGYQVENAATAFAVLRIADEHGFKIADAAIKRGFTAARWPGRFELLQKNPPVVLDAAHTPAAALRLRQSLDEYFLQSELITVIGVSTDKDLEGLLSPLLPRLGTVITTQSSHPRAMPAIKLADLLGTMGISASAEPDPAQALEAALSMVSGNSAVLIVGSVFLVEQVRDIYFNRR